MSIYTVPFVVYDYRNKGYGWRKGILSFDGARLEVQLRKSKGWRDFMNSEIEKLSYPLEKIAAVGSTKEGARWYMALKEEAT